MDFHHSRIARATRHGKSLLRRAAAGFNLAVQPFVDFMRQPADRAAAKADRLREGRVVARRLRVDLVVDRAARQAQARFKITAALNGNCALVRLGHVLHRLVGCSETIVWQTAVVRFRKTRNRFRFSVRFKLARFTYHVTNSVVVGTAKAQPLQLGDNFLRRTPFW